MTNRESDQALSALMLEMSIYSTTHDISFREACADWLEANYGDTVDNRIWRYMVRCAKDHKIDVLAQENTQLRKQVARLENNLHEVLDSQKG